MDPVLPVAPGLAPASVASIPLGAEPVEGGSRVLVWAPRAERVAVEMVADGSERVLEPCPGGYHLGLAEGLGPGDRYWLHLETTDGTLRRADPASRWQPDGVRGPSAVDDRADFPWTDQGWSAPARHELVIYELHVGTFTAAGTFAAASGRLAELAELGVTAVELMPVAAFPGRRNWGYDAVFPYAVQDSYGGPEGLRRFVDAAHDAGLAVILDVIYNHLGPEGNRLPDFGPYLTDRYATPWGDAVNMDGPGSDGVRRYVLENAVRWITDFHADGLRLDAVDQIHDESAHHILRELSTAVHATGDRRRRRTHVIAEDDRHDPRVVRPPPAGGHGCDAAWNDDLHHALHVALTGERFGYYVDFTGVADLAACLEDRFAYTGRHSRYRERRLGTRADDVPHDRFVVCAQNHDQVGNRPGGDRLVGHLGLPAQKLARAVVLLSPFTPLLFMGWEYGEPAPFPYFTDHSDPALVRAVRRGRREEFAGLFEGASVPDPQAESTFRSAVLDWDRRSQGDHGVLRELTRELLRLRRRIPAIADPQPARVRADAVGDGLVAIMEHPAGAAVLLANLGPEPVRLPVAIEQPEVRLDTAAERWGGGSAGLALDQDGATLGDHTAALLTGQEWGRA